MTQTEFQREDGRNVSASFYVCGLDERRDALFGILINCIEGKKDELQRKLWKKEFPRALRQLEDIGNLRQLTLPSYPSDTYELRKLELKYEDAEKYNAKILEQVVKMEPQATAEITELQSRRDGWSGRVRDFRLEKGVYDVYGRFIPLIGHARFKTGLGLVGIIPIQTVGIDSGVSIGSECLVAKLQIGGQADSKGTITVYYEVMPVRSIMKYRVLDPGNQRKRRKKCPQK